MEYIILFIYIAWFVLSIVAQFHLAKVPIIDSLRRLDKLKLIPMWTFFAPNPGQMDQRLVFKDYDESGAALSGWKEVDLPVSSALFRCVWNPHKRVEKLVSDAISEITDIIIKVEKDKRDGVIKLSTGYLNLLNIVLLESAEGTAVKYRQFAIVYTQGFDDNKAVIPFYLSSQHRCDF